MKNTLLYLGHASMRIVTAEGKVIYIDPFAGNAYDMPADLILVTHGHFDHNQTEKIKTQNPGCLTITYKEALKGGVHQTFDLGFVKVEAVEAGNNKNHSITECVGFILTFTNGKTVYLSGDTSTTSQMQSLADRDLDYAFFCCDGVFNMDMEEAVRCAKTVNAKISIPYHIIPTTGEAAFSKERALQFDVENRLILAPGEEMEI